ncbi:MAG: hypothetical protein HPY53_11265 [Brevinematales bacterium]|nr:hypothetical protein [Brevinematales bacterium]
MRKIYGILFIVFIFSTVPVGGKVLMHTLKRYEAALSLPKVMFYFMPGKDQPVPDTVYISCDYIQWDNSNPKYNLEKQEDGSFTGVIELFADSKNQMKVIINGMWVDNMQTFVNENTLKPRPQGYENDGFGGKTAYYIVK